ncbi:FAD-dependent oxidoreductase [Rhodococcus sp. NPDC003322]
MAEHYPIVIIGGGLGGLVAARVLHINGTDVPLFDLETDRYARTQGGMLDIHDHNGQLAIRAANLWDQFTPLVNIGGDATRVSDHHGTVLHDDAGDGEDTTRPEIDRGQLRDMLIDSLPPDAIRWGHKLTSIYRVGDRWNLQFDGGRTVTADLVIGADGAWSKTRPLLTDATPEYSGVSFIEADLWDADATHPAEAAAVGDGMLFALRGSAGFLAHKETDGSLHVYLGFRNADWIDELDVTDTAAAKDVVLSHLEDWDDALRGLIAHADTPLIPRRINVLPVGLRWDRVPGVTLLGDAAHVMSPFAGEGANLAMYDGAQLAQALLRHPEDTEHALLEYESDMFTRAAEATSQSAQGLDVIFAEDSPQSLIAMFSQMGPDSEHTD